MIIFNKEEENDRYHDWRREHPDGYVFNHFGGLIGEENIIHRASCYYLNRTNTNVEKVCSTDLEKLVDYVKSIRGNSWTYCSVCGIH